MEEWLQDYFGSKGGDGDDVVDSDVGTPIWPPPGTTPDHPDRESPINREQWNPLNVPLIDGSFSYWEAKSGTSIFVDVDQLSNVPLLTPTVARKLFPK